MKKFLSLFLALLMLFSFAACSNDGEKGGDGDEKDNNPKIPSAVKEEIVDDVADTYGFEADNFKVEFNASSDIAEMYFVSGVLKGECDDFFEEMYSDYEDGYFLSSVIVAEDEVLMCNTMLYEKNEKDEIKEEVDDFIEEYEDDKEAFEEELDKLAEVYMELQQMESDME